METRDIEEVKRKRLRNRNGTDIVICKGGSVKGVPLLPPINPAMPKFGRKFSGQIVLQDQ